MAVVVARVVALVVDATGVEGEATEREWRPAGCPCTRSWPARSTLPVHLRHSGANVQTRAQNVTVAIRLLTIRGQSVPRWYTRHRPQPAYIHLPAVWLRHRCDDLSATVACANSTAEPSPHDSAVAVVPGKRVVIVFWSYSGGGATIHMASYNGKMYECYLPTAENNTTLIGDLRSHKIGYYGKLDIVLTVRKRYW